MRLFLHCFVASLLAMTKRKTGRENEKIVLRGARAGADLCHRCCDLRRRFPSRPITMIVPFAAGGPTDVVGRLLAQRMGQTLGQNVVVEDVTGAAGTIGVGRVAHAPPMVTRSASATGARTSSTAQSTSCRMTLGRLRADHAVAQQSDADRCRQIAAGEESQGTGRLDQGSSERHHGHRGRRFRLAHRRR